MYLSNCNRFERFSLMISPARNLIRNVTSRTMTSSWRKSFSRKALTSPSSEGWFLVRKNRSKHLIHISSSKTQSVFFFRLTSSSHRLSFVCSDLGVRLSIGVKCRNEVCMKPTTRIELSEFLGRRLRGKRVDGQTDEPCVISRSLLPVVLGSFSQIIQSALHFSNLVVQLFFSHISSYIDRWGF